MKRRVLLGLILVGCATDAVPPQERIQMDDRALEVEPPLWLEGGDVEAGWGRALLVFSNQTLPCSALPKTAPGLRRLWKDEPVQGRGSGLLIWLQWTDLDQQIDTWEGRYLFGEAPVGDRAQRRAVLVPFEDGVPILHEPGRHGSIELVSLSETSVEGQIQSDRVQGPFAATRCPSPS